MILKCNNLTIGYDNHPIIKDINLEINQGDYVCILVIMVVVNLPL